MKTIIYKILSVFFLLFIMSCEKDFLEIADPNSIDNAVFWTSEVNATRAVNSIYSALKEPEFLGLDYHKYISFVSGEYDRPYAQDQSRIEFVEFTMQSENNIDWLMWKDLFRSIMRSNDVIGHVAEMSDEIITSEKKDELIGQAYFLRGFCELYLLHMYGKYYPNQDSSAVGIPLILRVAQSREEMFCTRSSVGTSYNQIISDFKEAENRLPVTWDTANKGRATKGAAIAYAASAHMWLNEYELAIETYKQLFDLDIYSLSDDFEINFHGKDENNSESIFEIQFGDFTSLNPWEGGSAQSLALEFGPTQLARGNAAVSIETSDMFALNYNITQAYLDNEETKELPTNILQYITELKGQTLSPEVFKGGLISNFGSEDYYKNILFIYKWIEGSWDPRWDATAFQKYDSIFPNDKWVPYNFAKYDYRPKKYIDSDRHAFNNGGTLGANEANIPLFRLAYAYLQYADALNQTGKSGEAVEFINKVKQRAYKNSGDDSWKLSAGLSKEQIQEELEIESLRELCGEGTRWKDMVRWGITDKYCLRRGFINGIHEALPIPKEELDLNPNMIQNEGY